MIFEIIFGHLERFVNTLANRNAGHDNDKFGKTVTFVHFQNGLGVNKSFSGTCFHFNRNGKSLIFRKIRLRQRMSFLHGMKIVLKRLPVNKQTVAKTEFILQQIKLCRIVGDRKSHVCLFLPFK